MQAPSRLVARSAKQLGVEPKRLSEAVVERANELGLPIVRLPHDVAFDEVLS